MRMLDETRDGMDADAMIRAIRGLPDQPKPSTAGADALLNGLDVVVERAAVLMRSA